MPSLYKCIDPHGVIDYKYFFDGRDVRVTGKMDTYRGERDMDRYEETVNKERKLTSEWNDHEGDMLYTMRVFGNYENGERRLLNEFHGDAEWAKRVAAHYNIDMPKED